MLKHYIRSSIIAIFQLIGIIALILLIAPILIEHSHSLSQLNQFLSQNKLFFCIGHSLFYLTFYLLWPKIVLIFAHHQREMPTFQCIQKAMHARCYLIALLILIELLNLLR